MKASEVKCPTCGAGYADDSVLPDHEIGPSKLWGIKYGTVVGRCAKGHRLWVDFREEGDGAVKYVVRDRELNAGMG